MSSSDHATRPAHARAARDQPGRPQPARSDRRRRRASARRSSCSLIFWKPAFVARRGRRRPGGGRGSSTHAFAHRRTSGVAARAADGRRRRDGARRPTCRRPPALRHRDSRSPALVVHAAGGCRRGRRATSATSTAAVFTIGYVPLLGGFAALLLARGRRRARGSSPSSCVTIASATSAATSRGAVRQAPDGAGDQPEEVLGGLRRLGRSPASVAGWLTVAVPAGRRAGGSASLLGLPPS